MSESTTPNDGQAPAPNGSPDNAQPQPEGAPSLRVLAQYLKDLSFENPKAPGIYTALKGPPGISVNVDVNARTIGNNQYEVELSVASRAVNEDEPVFVAEATYAGAFEILNVPEEQIEIVLLVECPRMIFPFVRQILSDTTQSGNFPPVLLDPIDFLAIYEQRKLREQQAAQGGAAV